MLDEFAGLEKKVNALGEEWSRWRQTEASLEEKKQAREATLREADYLRHVEEELSALDPQADEEDTLSTRRAELMAAEKVVGELRGAAETLSKNDVEGALGTAGRKTQRASAAIPDLEDGNPLAIAIERLDAALSETMEARAALDAALDRLDGDPGELEAVENRLFALRAAARKHGLQPQDLEAFLTKTRAALDAVELGEAAFADLEKAVADHRATYLTSADALSKARHKAAKALDKAVMNELEPLKLGKAHFSTSVESDRERPRGEGIDQVEFMVATNPGAPAGPLKSIASGGELSRFVLAMKAALAAKENRTVIIFDEVDAGVGGAVADAVGERLARLASDAQVLVVTHSPQVAARANHHWRIEKTQSKKSTVTQITPLEKPARVEEIARMLSGAEITEEARAAAERLLSAEPSKPKPKKSRKKRVAKAS